MTDSVLSTHAGETETSCEGPEVIAKSPELVTLVQSNHTETEGRLLITVSKLSGDSLQLLVSPHAKVLDIKCAIAQADVIPLEFVHLAQVGSGESLANTLTVEECALTNESKLVLIKRKASAPEIIKAMAHNPSMILGGKRGSGNESLYCPRGAPAFVPTHPYLLVVVDNCNHRIKVHDTRTGKLLCTMGKAGRHGNHEGEFFYPHGVAVTKDGKFVVVADKDNQRLQVLNLSVSEDGSAAELKFVQCIDKDKTPDGKLYPLGVDIRPDGTIVVSDVCRHARILEFKLDGTFIRSFEVVGAGGEGDVAVLASGEVAVADEENERVAVFNCEGTLVRMIGGSRGPADGQFQGPTTLAADDYGNLVVLDKNSSRVQVFGPEGQHLCTRNDLAVFRGWFKGIAWDAVGGLAIANSMAHNTLIWSVAAAYGTLSLD